MLVQRSAFQVEAWQTGSTADSASYRMVVSRRGTYFWGTLRAVAIHDHEGRIVYWSAPKKSSWKWDGSVYYLNDYDGSKQVLSWEYWAPQSGYITANSLTYDRTVSIDRGNNRQGSKTVNIGIQSTYTDSRFITCRGDLTLTTSKIADVSNVSLSVSADDKSISNRYIRVSASFTNPENYYTGYLYHGSTLLGSTTGSISQEIKITYDMFDTTQNFNFIIKGRDEITYSTKLASVNIEPSGVGIWYKQDNTMKEVFHVYYKNNNGDMIEVTEAWAKKNNQIIKTVK